VGAAGLRFMFEAFAGAGGEQACADNLVRRYPHLGRRVKTTPVF
jgi:hypothetical protein